MMGEPLDTPKANTAKEMTSTSPACLFASCSSFIFRGASASPSVIMPEIRPSSVSRPVAVTTALQLP